jgi:hypothetical protein
MPKCDSACSPPLGTAAATCEERWPEDPNEWREEFRRRMAERGVHVRLPRPGATWEPPEHPLPISADELSRFVVELRHTGRL